MNKVFVVTKGQYSDYHIVTVFDNEPAANSLVEAINKRHEVYEDARVEEYRLNNTSIPENMNLYYVAEFIETGWVAYVDYDFEELGQSGIEESGRRQFYTYCLARDEQHALKIGSERHAFMVANELKSCDFGGEVKDVSDEN